MNPAEYARMYALEDWYWWFVARRAAAARFLRDHAEAVAEDQPLRILDAGCGTGGMLDLFGTWPDTEATGLDFSPDALSFSHSRGHQRLVGGDVTQLPFRSNTFDAVTALDVVEHISNEEGALGEICRVLRPGGVLVASVPAYQFLWGPHDVALHHCRRYNAQQFREAIHRSGLRVERQTYLLSALFPLAAGMRLATRGRKQESAEAGLPRVPGFVNQALIGLQAAELAVARRVGLPFGLSLLAVARKPVAVPKHVEFHRVEEGMPVAVGRW